MLQLKKSDIVIRVQGFQSTLAKGEEKHSCILLIILKKYMHEKNKAYKK